MCRYGTQHLRSTIVATTTPHIPQQGCVSVCTSTGNRSVWLSSSASQYPPELSRKIAQQVGTSPMSASMPGHSLHLVGIRCRRLERPKTLRTRRCRAGLRVARRGHLTVECPGQSVKEYEARAATGDETLCLQPAGDNADQCRDELRRARHTAVIHYDPRRLRCVGQDPSRTRTVRR